MPENFQINFLFFPNSHQLIQKLNQDKMFEDRNAAFDYVFEIIFSALSRENYALGLHLLAHINILNCIIECIFDGKLHTAHIADIHYRRHRKCLINVFVAQATGCLVCSHNAHIHRSNH